VFFIYSTCPARISIWRISWQEKVEVRSGARSYSGCQG
jgi:hypothetical protein